MAEVGTKSEVGIPHRKEHLVSQIACHKFQCRNRLSLTFVHDHKPDFSALSMGFHLTCFASASYNLIQSTFSLFQGNESWRKNLSALA
jgi:hypothetical protein